MPAPLRLRRPLSILAFSTLLLPLAGCDMLSELFEIPNPSREQAERKAEGEAIGSACRHAGRSLEDCYALNRNADKASVFAGWRDMNDYMMQHNLQEVPSQLVPGTPAMRIIPDKPLIAPPAASPP